MSEDNQPPVISGALTYPAPSSSQHVLPQQPRQPQSLQGLLRFAMEATKAEDAPGQSILGPLDEERKKFLEDALKSMTVDVIEILLQAIKKLKNAADISLDSDVTEYVEACESILEYVDRIDTAIDFHKIGGYEIFQPCFTSVHGQIRSNACNILAEICQNNPYCQDRALECGFVKALLDLIDKDPESSVTIKAVYALSCLLREYEKAIVEFRKESGISVLMRALHKPAMKIRIKVCFLLTSLCCQSKELQDDLINAGYVQLFITFLTEERTDLHEHILSALCAIIKNNDAAIAECRREKYGLQSIISNHLRQIEKIDEAMEEREYCRDILSIVFPTKRTSVER